jgi:hypothetical protein
VTVIFCCRAASPYSLMRSQPRGGATRGTYTMDTALGMGTRLVVHTTVVAMWDMFDSGGLCTFTSGGGQVLARPCPATDPHSGRAIALCPPRDPDPQKLLLGPRKYSLSIFPIENISWGPTDVPGGRDRAHTPFPEGRGSVHEDRGVGLPLLDLAGALSALPLGACKRPRPSRQ